MAKFYACVLSIILLAALPLPAQAPGLADVYNQIRIEETNNSKIMWIIHRDCRRVWPARDGDAQSESRGRLGGENDDLVGIGQRASGALDVSASQRCHAGSRLGKHGTLGRGRGAVPRAIGSRTAGVDAEHERRGHCEGGDAAATGTDAASRWIRSRIRGRASDSARSSANRDSTAHAACCQSRAAAAAHAGRARCLFEFDEGQSAGRDRAGRQTCGGAGGLQSGAAAPHRRRMESAVRSQ